MYPHIKANISEWFIWKGYNAKFEEMDKEVLADVLREFYPFVHQMSQQGETEGKP